LIPGDGDVFAGSITWSPDGTWIAFSSSDAQFGGGYPKLVVLNVDSGELYILTSSHGLLTVEEYSNMDRNESALPADQPMFTPDWSPDGSQIAFGTRHGGDHAWPNIWVAQWNGKESRRITSLSWRSDPQAFDPTWSPDGHHIAFVTHELYTDDGYLKSPPSSSLRMINADGSSMTTILEMESVEYIQEPDWGPE
jgi:Tol biopolymer transport system component